MQVQALQRPFGKQARATIVRQFEEERRVLVAGEAFGARFDWRDSMLSRDPFDPGASFEVSFERVLPRRVRLREYIEQRLAPWAGHALGIEFGGCGSRLFRGFSEGFFERSIGVSLEDPRCSDLVRAEDADRGHQVLLADIMHDETYAQLASVMASARAHLIVERLARGMECIPEEPHTAMNVFQRWYGMLAPGGLIFAHVPAYMSRMLMPWAELVRARCDGSIELQVATGTCDHRADLSSVMLLSKNVQAPDRLPTLCPRQVRVLVRSH